MKKNIENKDLYLNFLRLLKYATSFSALAICISIIITTLFDTGFFLYYGISINFIPISISEVLKESMILFPMVFVLLPLVITTPFLKLIIRQIKIQTKREREKISRQILIQIKRNEKEEVVRQIQIERKRTRNRKIILSIELVICLAIVIYLMLCGQWIGGFSLIGALAMLLIIERNDKEFRKSIIIDLIFVVIFLSPIFGYSYAIYIDEQRFQEKIFMKDGKIFDEIKILKVINNGILILDKESNLQFIYNDAIRSYNHFATKNFKFENYFKKTKVIKKYIIP